LRKRPVRQPETLREAAFIFALQRIEVRPKGVILRVALGAAERAAMEEDSAGFRAARPGIPDPAVARATRHNHSFFTSADPPPPIRTFEF